jgi:dTDP-4-amino-4,6-dideoxygalactose transaminase
MRLHGISRDIFDRYVAPGTKWYYEVVAPGYKCNLSDIASAIGVEQLKKARSFQQRRQHISERYMQAMKALPLTLPAAAPAGDTHSWHLFVIRLNDNAPIARDDFIERMQKEYNIGCSVHFVPLPLHPYWKETFHLTPEDYPNAVAAYQRAVSLPIYTKMTDEQVTRVIDAVIALLS